AGTTRADGTRASGASPRSTTNADWRWHERPNLYPSTEQGELHVPGEVLYQDQCEIQLNPTPPVLPGKAARAWWHGHMLTPDLPVPMGCRNYREGEVVGNGISVEDQDFAAESGYPGYGLDENQLFKVEPNGNWNGMPWTEENFCRR
ncbi:MAG: hypothetical protein ACREA0_31560, partial [bacterium]